MFFITKTNMIMELVRLSPSHSLVSDPQSFAKSNFNRLWYDKAETLNVQEFTFAEIRPLVKEGYIRKDGKFDLVDLLSFRDDACKDDVFIRAIDVFPNWAQFFGKPNHFIRVTELKGTVYHQRSLINALHLFA